MKKTFEKPALPRYAIAIGIDPATVTGMCISIYDSETLQTKDLVIQEVNLEKAAKKMVGSVNPKEERVPLMYWKIYVPINDLIFSDIFKGTGKEYIIVACLEHANAYGRGKSAVKLGNELRGAVKVSIYNLMKAYPCNICYQNSQIVEISPVELKRFATGNPIATKEMMIAAAMRYHKDPDLVMTDNIADALFLQKHALNIIKQKYNQL